MSYFSIAKGFHKLSSHPPPDLTQKELDRLRAITIYKKTKDIYLSYPNEVIGYPFLNNTEFRLSLSSKVYIGEP